MKFGYALKLMLMILMVGGICWVLMKGINSKQPPPRPAPPSQGRAPVSSHTGTPQDRAVGGGALGEGRGLEKGQVGGQ